MPPFSLHIEPLPYLDPVAAFAPFAAEPVAALLGGDGQGIAYLAVEPFRVIRAVGERVWVDDRLVAGDPFSVLKGELAKLRMPVAEGPVPFQTGAVGVFGYELGRHLKRLPPPAADTLGVPELLVGVYDVIAAFDARTRQAWVLASGLPETDPERRRKRARARAAQLIERLRLTPPLPPLPEPSGADWRADFTSAGYCRRVARIQDYIRAGDVFQVNFSQRFLADLPAEADGFALFRRLLTLAPAPYAAFLGCGAGVQLASASPERFLALDAEGRVETRPIKGTRRRGATPEEDRRLLEELAVSPKDRAENLMICDLLRNDLSRVCAVGSVRVPQLAQPETFAAVHHLVSVVTARLRPGLGAIDLLRAAFPGGSITGAPKIRAMEIIAELEAARRGPYCGAIGWIGCDGAMDSSIVIRTLTVAGSRVVAQAGGGIVSDSDPAAEYDEMRTKIAPLLAALGEVRECP